MAQVKIEPQSFLESRSVKREVNKPDLQNEFLANFGYGFGLGVERKDWSIIYRFSNSRMYNQTIEIIQSADGEPEEVVFEHGGNGLFHELSIGRRFHFNEAIQLKVEAAASTALNLLWYSVENPNPHGWTPNDQRSSVEEVGDLFSPVIRAEFCLLVTHHLVVSFRTGLGAYVSDVQSLPDWYFSSGLGLSYRLDSETIGQGFKNLLK